MDKNFITVRTFVLIMFLFISIVIGCFFVLLNKKGKMDKKENDTTIKPAHTIIFVKDIKVSRDFYSSVLGLSIIEDFGVMVLFENNFAIHQYDAIHKTIFKKDLNNNQLCSGNFLVYMVSRDIEKSYQDIKIKGVKFIHGIEKQAWGERVFRFYDPDGHMIEIGEDLKWIQPSK